MRRLKVKLISKIEDFGFSSSSLFDRRVTIIVIIICRSFLDSNLSKIFIPAKLPQAMSTISVQHGIRDSLQSFTVIDFVDGTISCSQVTYAFQSTYFERTVSFFSLIIVYYDAVPVFLLFALIFFIAFNLIINNKRI